MADILQDELIAIELPDLDSLRLHLSVCVANSNKEKKGASFCSKKERQGECRE